MKLKWKILVWTAIILAIIAMALTFVRIEKASWAAESLIGWAIAILALLVTVLIAWQIYTTINIKDEIKEIKTRTDSALLNVGVQSATLSASVYIAIFDEIRKKGEDVYGYFKYGLLIILHAQSAGDIGMCESMIKALNESFPVTKAIRNTEKAGILTIAAKISETRIHGIFKDLHGRLIVELKSTD